MIDAARDDRVKAVELRTNDDSGLVSTAFLRPVLRWRLAATRPAVWQIAYENQRSAGAAFPLRIQAGA